MSRLKFAIYDVDKSTFLGSGGMLEMPKLEYCHFTISVLCARDV